MVDERKKEGTAENQRNDSSQTNSSNNASGTEEGDFAFRRRHPEEEDVNQQQEPKVERKRARRWDMPTPGTTDTSDWDADHSKEGRIRGAESDATERSSSSVVETPVLHRVTATGRRSRWDATPVASSGTTMETPLVGSGGTGADTGARTASRWDATPVGQSQMMATPIRASAPSTTVAAPTLYLRSTARYFTDAELDDLLPSSGYAMVAVPQGYVPIRTPARKLMQTPAAGEGAASGFSIPEEQNDQMLAAALGAAPGGNAMGEFDAADMPFRTASDFEFFGKLLQPAPEEDDIAALKERRILKLLLRIKNGQGAVRRSAMRQIVEKAREFGAEALFEALLPLLLTPAIEDEERHVLVKVIDRCLFKLDALVRPFVHNILVVVEPMLLEGEYAVRAEAHEIIANLCKAAGVPAMLATLRPDMDHADDSVRASTARVFGVLAGTVGLAAVLPFVRAACASRKNEVTRHTAMRIVQQIAQTLGTGVLPHLTDLVASVASALTLDTPLAPAPTAESTTTTNNATNTTGNWAVKVRMVAALAIAALAEAAAPHGIACFDSALKPLWTGVRSTRGKTLAAFLKALGNLVALMEPEFAGRYASDLLPTLLREFSSPEDEMRRIVLRVLRQCVASTGLATEAILTDVLPQFVRNFWVRRSATITTADRRMWRAVLETTVTLARRVGLTPVLAAGVLQCLRDEHEPLRRMALDTVSQCILRLQPTNASTTNTLENRARFNVADASRLALVDLPSRLETQLMDGLMLAVQEHTGSGDDRVLLDAVGTVLAALGPRIRPHIPALVSACTQRLQNRSVRVRHTAAALVSRIVPCIAANDEAPATVLARLGSALYENLGEEFPDVLAAIIDGLHSLLKACSSVARMQPSLKDLLPRLTPILRNRHDAVQGAVISLIGTIADRSAESASAREWMRICFELLDCLKAPRKSVRRAATAAFGHIARAIGPHDVISALLNNLKVQERQNRVCTTVAIAIIAEQCAPFTVLPALLAEYRVPELNVQNGVLRAVAFMFEYIAEMGKDYVYAVTPLLEDALMERDQVHRQTAALAIRHIATGVAGFGCEDALQHLLNWLWPNILEYAAPHVFMSVLDAIAALRVALGPGLILQYVLAGLFHPARKIRSVYWILWNELWIGSADALVPFYPMLTDSLPTKRTLPGQPPEPKKTLCRHVLNVVL